MSETKRGRLGVAELAAATNTVVYSVTDGNEAKVTLFVSNLAGAEPSTTVNVAIINGAIGALADEDYIIRGQKLLLGEFIELEDLQLSADECIMVYSTEAGITVRVSGIEQDAVFNAVNIQKLTSQELDHAAFTNETGTALGNIDFTSGTLPAGAIILGWKAVTSEGFAGDTTAIVQVGIEGDVDRFSAAVDGSCLAAGTVGSAAIAADMADGISAVCTPRVTVTGGADWDSISAGKMVVDIYYLNTATATVETTTYPIHALVSQDLAIANFTDVAATGYIDFISPLPANAIPISWKAVTSEGFAGDTTAVVMVGIVGDTNRFSADETKSCLAAGTVGAAAIAADAVDGIAAACTPRVTVTGGADFTSIATNAEGAMVVTLYYFLAE